MVKAMSLPQDREKSCQTHTRTIEIHVTKFGQGRSLRGHDSRDFHIHAIEEVFGDDFVAMTREHHWINRADTVRRGLNTYKT